MDSLLFQEIDEVDMEADYRTNFLDFFERVVESEPAFSPGLSSEAEFDCESEPGVTLSHYTCLTISASKCYS